MAGHIDEFDVRRDAGERARLFDVAARRIFEPARTPR